MELIDAWHKLMYGIRFFKQFGTRSSETQAGTGDTGAVGQGIRGLIKIILFRFCVLIVDQQSHTDSDCVGSAQREIKWFDAKWLDCLKSKTKS